jgi:hypothetical protein
MAGIPAKGGRRLKTLEQLRLLRERVSPPDVTPNVKRRAEDRIREERHDALAKSICAGRYAEQRRYRSPSELRAQREDDERQWQAAQRHPTRKKRR